MIHRITIEAERANGRSMSAMSLAASHVHRAYNDRQFHLEDPDVNVIFLASQKQEALNLERLFSHQYPGISCVGNCVHEPRAGQRCQVLIYDGIVDEILWNMNPGAEWLRKSAREWEHAIGENGLIIHTRVGMAVRL